MRTVDVFDAIRLRRSIKPQHIKPDPVDRPRLERLFEAANWAPTHGKTEPWRFVVFEGSARKALAEAVIAAMAKPGETIPDDDPRRADTIAKMTQPPVVIAIVVSPSTNPKIVEHEEVISTGIAVQNMALAARAMGLATYWTSGAKAFAPSMQQFLGLTPPARCLGFFYVGWPQIPWPEGERRPALDKVTWRSS